ncbi:MAG: hypothetical protein ACKVS6_17390 [Planctomycetota bacterium]
MKTRIIAGAFFGFLATAAGYVVCQNASELRPEVALGVAVGGALGTVVATISCGAQVALVIRKPASNASFTAFAGGFFTKLLVLVVGILLLNRPGSAMDATGFGISFLCTAGIVSIIILSLLTKK